MNRYTLSIQLTVLGPFLTAATSSETYGLDKAFYRTAEGKAAVPGSHVKGKLRMALNELFAAEALEPSIDLGPLFGQPSAAGSYEPERGLLQFTDFTCGAEVQDRRRVRTAINPVSLTAAENMLREFEDLFPSGAEIEWRGSVAFVADEAKALQIAKLIRLGFKWLTTMGAEKGVGSGRLARVMVSQPEAAPETEQQSASFAEGDTLQLRIRPNDRLLIGGVKKPRANFVRSERIITGAVIKGALAAGMNAAYGMRATEPLSSESGAKMPGFELLAEHFDKIRVGHAFPTLKGGKRPVRLPLSTVKTENGILYDVALSPDPAQLIDGQAPLYSIDWKTPEDFFEVAAPKEIFVTRTKIDNESRRSEAGQLFTYTFLCADDHQGRAVEWVCSVDFSAIPGDQAVRTKTKQQFTRAVSSYLGHLGKLNQPVTVELLPAAAPAAAESYGLIYADLAVVTLQTDAVMLDPRAVRGLAAGEDLHGLYAAYWDQAARNNPQLPPCLELVDFFACQNFQGGYLYHRYQGAGERTESAGRYYPYYLTGAGSVFVLRVIEQEQAALCLKRWLQAGLALPGWARQQYSQGGRAPWQSCPFVPENGYGEVAVNLKWHWDRRADSQPQNIVPTGGKECRSS